jgi:dTDP-4-amino-4,6-dideoxygalactose transaminase
MVGAEVVFADVVPNTGLMGVAQLEAALARAQGLGLRVKVILPVHLNGQSWDPPAIWEVAQRHQLLVIEDACHALGATYSHGGDWISVGSCRHSDLTVFSFHPTKIIATGEGGAITSRDPDRHQRLCRLRSHGIVYDPRAFRQPELAVEADGSPKPWYYEMQEIGYNYRLSDIQCSLGISQLSKLARLTAARRRLAQRYGQALAELAPVLQPVTIMPSSRAAWHIYVVLLDFAQIGRHRTGFMQGLRQRGVGSQVHYLPLPWHPYYRERYGEGDFPGATAYYARCLSLPLYPALSLAEQDRVIGAIRALLVG